MRVLFGIIRLFLEWPEAIRRLLELIILLIVVLLLWPLIKHIFIFVLKFFRVFNMLLVLAARFLIGKLRGWSRNVYNWDEKVGKIGGDINDFYESGIKWLQDCKRSKLLLRKSTILALIVLYFMAILPVFHLDNIFNEYYLETFYYFNQIFAYAEDTLLQKAEEYPPLFKEKEEMTEEVAYIEIESEEPVEEEIPSIQLMLGKDIYYANVRENAFRTAPVICVVSKEDIFLYQNQYEFDGERYWLLVMVESQDNKTGWISHKVIDDEIISSLNLE